MNARNTRVVKFKLYQHIKFKSQQVPQTWYRAHAHQNGTGCYLTGSEHRMRYQHWQQLEDHAP